MLWERDGTWPVAPWWVVAELGAPQLRCRGAWALLSEAWPGRPWNKVSFEVPQSMMGPAEGHGCSRSLCHQATDE